MDADALRRLCFSFNGAVEELPFFKVAGKVFAIAPLDAEPPLRLGADFIRDMLEDSYDLVVSALPKRVQRELGWSPSGQD